MKKKFTLLLFLFVSVRGFSQTVNPSYIDIITAFAKKYDPSEDYENYTSFAKKKDGWYIIQINKVQNDRLLKENLFFSLKENRYFDLSAYYNLPQEIDINKQLQKYLNEDGSTANWYAFEHIPYYGYNGWYKDVINDFGKLNNLSDTTYD